MFDGIQVTTGALVVIFLMIYIIDYCVPVVLCVTFPKQQTGFHALLLYCRHCTTKIQMLMILFELLYFNITCC